MNRPRQIDDATLRKLWFSRLPDRVVAERMGHHRGVLRRRAMKLGFPRRRVIWNVDSVRKPEYECVP